MQPTPEEMQTLRERLSPEALEVAEMVISGTPLRLIQETLRIGFRLCYRLIGEAEAVLGRRIRWGHGRPKGTPVTYLRPTGEWARRPRKPKPGRPPIKVSSVAPVDVLRMPAGDRCPRCWLSNPHVCEVEISNGQWTGDDERSLRERFTGGRNR